MTQKDAFPRSFIHFPSAFSEVFSSGKTATLGLRNLESGKRIKPGAVKSGGSLIRTSLPPFFFFFLITIFQSSRLLLLWRNVFLSRSFSRNLPDVRFTSLILSSSLGVFRKPFSDLLPSRTRASLDVAATFRRWLFVSARSCAGKENSVTCVSFSQTLPSSPLPSLCYEYFKLSWIQEEVGGGRCGIWSMTLSAFFSLYIADF